MKKRTIYLVVRITIFVTLIAVAILVCINLINKREQRTQAILSDYANSAAKELNDAASSYLDEFKGGIADIHSGSSE